MKKSGQSSGPGLRVRREPQGRRPLRLQKVRRRPIHSGFAGQYLQFYETLGLDSDRRFGRSGKAQDLLPFNVYRAFILRTNFRKCGKSLGLHNQGLLGFNDKISDHWPEFAANGKGEATVAQLLRHEAGLAKYQGERFHSSALLPENIKKNQIGIHLERQKQNFPNPKHGTTRYTQ